ncbi:MAG: acetyltransferase [Yoonia sp.]|uniref:GNAT family N-acetyltransferase n=1 Tax=Yoonia sp. TaxID=2212373 RepID=UPI00273D5A5A|nr:GNAT family N-acetyltransferase [Yoonia sp.]MDP5084818.1 acetyltransferase [Yoonia sp.]
MEATRQYIFRKATMDDLSLLTGWQSQPHVREWWGETEPYDEEEIADIRVARWIVETDGKPFAFMQDYTVHGWVEHHFARLPKGSRGIDQYIGEPDMIGLGHGSAFIRARVRSLFEAGAPVVATDPHPDNERAIAVYKKIGFEVAGPPQDSRWGLILPMQAKRKIL